MPRFLQAISNTLTRAGYTVTAGSTAIALTVPGRFVPLMKQLLRYGFQAV